MRTITASRDLPVPPAAVVAVIVGPAFQAARAEEFGGQPAAVIRQGARVTVAGPRRLPVDEVPALARTFLPADGTLQQTDVWDLTSPDAPTGSWRVDAAGVPVQLDGAYHLSALGAGSRYRIDGRVSVRVPLVGGSLETMAAEHIGRLLEAELDLLADWCARA